MDMTNTPAQTNTKQTEIKKPINPTGWGYFFTCYALAFIFWILELAYTYLFSASGDVALTLIRGSAFAGATLIGAALFSSAVFKWLPRYARFWPFRRHVGDAGFIIVLVHVTTSFYTLYGGNFSALFFTLNPIQNPALFGVIAFPILLGMALTSTDWAMRTIGGTRWKLLHRFVYVAFAAIILHYGFVNPRALTNPAGYVLIFVTALAIFGQLYWFFKTISIKKYRSLGTVIGFTIIIIFAILFYLSYRHLNRP